jgi:hypothetical protein
MHETSIVGWRDLASKVMFSLAKMFSMLLPVFKALVGRDDDPDDSTECGHPAKLFKNI